MNEDGNADKKQQDLVLTHSIVNYLSAGYQGRYTFFNILARLEFTDLKKEPIQEIQETLKCIGEWNKDLKKGMSLFSATWTSPQTFEAKRALKLLAELKHDLLQTTAQLVTLISLENEKLDDDLLKYLVAAYGRFAYARENYVRGFVDFSESIKNKELADQYRANLDSCAGDIQLVHTLMQQIKELAQEQRSEFISALKYHCLSLPGAFRAQAHDITILLFTYKGDLTFEAAGIEAENAQEWQEMGALPEVAGYWESFGIGPAQAGEWSKIGVADHEVAAAWLLHGFTHETALAWLEKGIPPIIAVSWNAAGFTPEQTAFNLREGIADPAQGERRQPDGPGGDSTPTDSDSSDDSDDDDDY